MWQIKKSGTAPSFLDSVGSADLRYDTPVVVVNEESDRHTDLKVELHKKLLDLINLSALDTMSRAQVQAEIGDIVHEQLAQQKHALNQKERMQLVEDVLDELLGLGPLEPLLKDETITDILVNGYNLVFVERHGRLEESKVRFKDDRHLQRIIQKIVGAVGRRIDESSPYVDARLADGSRINAIIPPLAVDGALLSIRKFAKIPINMAKLIEFGSIPAPVAEILRAIVQARRNVLISGGTGSGKTTLLNAMSAYIDGTERIVTIEDSAELQLQQRHVARLETRPANIEGRGEVTQRDLVKNALRMRPDRIIVGEVRAGEAFDMLQAMNTGHDGSMTTCHANSARDAFSRLETMVMMASSSIPDKVVRQMLTSAVHIVIQVSRLNDGSRKIMSISEVADVEDEHVNMEDIFIFERSGMSQRGKALGKFRATGYRPRCMDRLKAYGVHLSQSIFSDEMEIKDR